MTIRSSASLFNSSAIRTSSVDRSLTSTRCGSLRRERDVGDALDELRLVHRVRNAGDVDRLGRCASPGPSSQVRAHADRAGAGLVDLLRISCCVFMIWPPVGKSGPFDVAWHSCAMVSSSRSASIILMSAVQTSPRLCGGMFVAMPTAMPVAPLTSRFGMRAGSTTGSVLRAVVVGPERDGVLIDLGEHLVADAREPAFRVAHRRGAVAVERAEVAGAVDERIAQRERLRHADERLVERRVAVRVVVAHHVADDLRALAVLGVGREVLLPHRVEDAALDGLQAVADVRQRARRDDRQRVVQIARLGGLVERDDFVATAGSDSTAAGAAPATPAAGRTRDHVGLGLHAIKEGFGFRATLRHGEILRTGVPDGGAGQRCGTGVRDGGAGRGCGVSTGVQVPQKVDEGVAQPGS